MGLVLLSAFWYQAFDESWLTSGMVTACHPLAFRTGNVSMKAWTEKVESSCSRTMRPGDLGPLYHDLIEDSTVDCEIAWLESCQSGRKVNTPFFLHAGDMFSDVLFTLAVLVPDDSGQTKDLFCNRANPVIDIYNFYNEY